jgi:signal transduction histidine kinase
VKLGRLSQRLREAPARELEAAAAELAQPGSSEDRRADLSRFVELAGLELAKVVGSAPAELAAIEEQVVHVHQILVDQQQYARAARVLEPVALDDLCAETARLLPEDLHRAITLEIEPSLKEVGPVLAARVALQQILSNLFINAAESVRAAGRDGGGRLRLSASREQEDGMQRAHVRVEDNGRGIRPEQMARLFERGYTTKTQGSSGLGLHWSATTAASMSGRLYAESAGEGRGACLHLLLPLAADRPAAAPGETQ